MREAWATDRERLTRKNSRQITFRLSKKEYRWRMNDWKRSHVTLRE